MEEEGFSPRSYQTEIAELAKRKNTIIFLPTGCGKTFIAVLVLKHFLSQEKRSFSEGGKLSVFVVNTVVLVDQQAVVLEKHLPIKEAGRYFGALNVDTWSREIWVNEFEQHEVLVMTAEIFRIILAHAFLLPKQIAVVIFDECHHGEGDSPMHEAARLIAISREEKPRIIGLSATLLNANAKTIDEAKKSVANMLDNFDAVLGCIRNEAVSLYSTNPIEEVISYDQNTVVVTSEVLSRTKQFCYVFGNSHNAPKRSNYGRRLKKVGKDVKSLLVTVDEVLIESLGIYGGSIGCLSVIKMLEFMKAPEKKVEILLQLTHAINAMTTMYCQLEAHFAGFPEQTRAYDFSSPKVRTLVDLLFDVSKEENNFRCLILIQRRMSAAMLCTVLKIARIPKYSFLKPAFIVGTAGLQEQFTGQAEAIVKRNRHAMKAFASGEANVLVSTDVTEEGIDIPLCNCVVKFDKILTYRSYMQSKGRARSRESHYYVLEKKETVPNTKDRLEIFRRVQTYLLSLVRGTETDADSVLPVRDVAEEPLIYETGKATLRDLGAMSILNKYVSMFNSDRYTVHNLRWKIRKVDRYGCPIRRRGNRVNDFEDEDWNCEDGHWGCEDDREATDIYFIAELSFPRVVPIKWTITSEKKGSIKLAKRNAAFQMCVDLHKLGELDDDLVPVAPEAHFTPDPSWWPHSKITEELKSRMKGDRLGTKEQGQLYFSSVPKCLTNCAPKKQEAFLHLFNVKPKCDIPPRNELYNLIYNLVLQDGSYALVTATQMPMVCIFPVYSRIGELEVEFIPNYDKIRLTDEEVNKLESFMSVFFVEVASCLSTSEFQMASGGKDYLVVPTKTDHGKTSIDWDVVSSCLSHLKSEKPSDEDRLNLKVCKDTYYGSVITPWYRQSGGSILIVNEIREDLNAFSEFPGLECSFSKRFCDHYGVETLTPQLPLLEVVTFSKLVTNGLRRRYDNTDSRRANMELYLPDLVNISPLSATLWIKATLLPTILFRLERLMTAEELRSEMAREASLGYVEPPSDFVWQPLEAESEETIENDVGDESLEEEPDRAELLEADPEEEQPKASEHQQEDVDFDIDFWDVETGSQSINVVCEYLDVLKYQSNNSWENVNRLYEDVAANLEVPPLKLLRASGNPEGIQLNKVFTALTAPSANDIVNYERMETLGDAFLKVAVSLFLYETCPLRSEGQLTDLKGRFIGNRNLFNCALNKKLPEVILNFDGFLPKGWFPPKCIPSVKQLLRKKYDTTGKGVDDLIVKFSSVSLDEKPRFVSAHQMDDLEAIRCNGTQLISDKTVADCVEALLGAALLDSGWNGALDIMLWFEIVPKMVKRRDETVVSLKQLLQQDYIEPGTASSHIVAKEVEVIQSILGYSFSQTAILRQALTHPTFDAVNNYESLEFIGDAVLDFLITAYIYEYCGLLSPGKMTDLRSALVNNITFAALTVKYGFNRFMLMNSPALMQAVDAFVNFQKDSRHKIDSNVLILCDESEIKISDQITVPKALADMFEALAGAIFFDSGRDFCTVWRVFYPIMHPVIVAFCKNIPLDPVRNLYETHTDCKFNFEYNRDEKNNRQIATCTVQSAFGTHKYHGYGENRKMAKKAVAKLILHSMKILKEGGSVQDLPSR